MFSSPGSRLLLLSVLLLPACSAKMQTRMDAVWERLDPMGHRKGHQVHYYPRANNPGMTMPEDEEQEKLLKKARKENKYALPMPGYGRGGSPSAGSGDSSSYALPGSSGYDKRAVSPDGYALPGGSMARPKD